MGGSFMGGRWGGEVSGGVGVEGWVGVREGGEGKGFEAWGGAG